MANAKTPAGCYWRADTIWGRVQVKGRVIRWSLKTSDPAIARKRYAADKGKVTADMTYGDAPRLFEDVVLEWGPHNLAECGANTHKRYLCSLGQIGEFLEGRKQSDIDQRVVAEIVRERRKTGITNATIKRDLGALSSVLGFAMAQGWRSDNPARAHLGTFKERRDPIVLPLDADIDLVIACADLADRRPGAQAVGMWPELVQAARITGARLDELVNAKRSNLDLPRKQLTLIGKGNKLRTIDLVPFGGVEFFDGLTAHIKSDLLFWHDNGEPYRNPSSNFANNIIGAATRNAEAKGLKFRPFRFHDLRHKHAVDWLQSGRDIFDLQKRLGHASIATTEGYLKYVTTEVERNAKFTPRKAG